MSYYIAPQISNSNRKNLLKEAERIMHDEWEANGYDDRGTCVLGAGIAVDGSVAIKQVTQGNVSSYAAAKPAIKFLNEHGIDAHWDDGIMD